MLRSRRRCENQPGNRSGARLAGRRRGREASRADRCQGGGQSGSGRQHLEELPGECHERGEEQTHPAEEQGEAGECGLGCRARSGVALAACGHLHLGDREEPQPDQRNKDLKDGERR